MLSRLRFLYAAPHIDAAGHRVLVLPRFFGLLGIACLVGGVAIPLSILATPGPSPGGLAWLGLLCFTAPGLYLVLSTYVHRIVLTPTGLQERGLFGRMTTLRWAQLQAVHFHALSQQLILSDGRHRVRCHVSLLGFEVLGQALREQLEPTGEDFALPWHRLRTE